MSLKIAYEMRKKAKNMANGGACDEHGLQMCEMCHGGDMMAEGGEARKPYQNPNPAKNPNDPIVEGVDHRGAPIHQSKEAKMAAKSRYNSERLNHKRGGYAEGGDVVEDIMKGRGEASGTWMGNPAIGGGKPKTARDMDDAAYYSKGGQVSNDVGEGQEAAKLPNQFDDLVLRDDMEFNYTGANSGDEIGDAQEDEDQRDMVSMIMKSRKKKDRLPNPR